MKQNKYKAETVQAIKRLYSERKDTIDYMEKFGNPFEQAQATLIKEVAAMNSTQNTRERFDDHRGYFGNSQTYPNGGKSE